MLRVQTVLSPELFLECAEMSDIKTKETTRDIKVIDKSAAALHNVKQASVRTKDHIGNLTDDGYVSPAEYTEDKLKGAVESGAVIVGEGTRKQVKKAADQIKDRIREKHIEKRQQGASQNANRTTVVQRRSASVRNTRIADRQVRSSARLSGKPGVRNPHRSVKAAQRTVKTTEQTAKVAVKTSKAAAETSKKAAETTARAAKAAAIAAKKDAIAIYKAAVAVGKVVVNAVVSAGKAIAGAFQALAAAIGAGGAVAVVAAVLICTIALILGSAEGIFFSSEDTGGRTMQSVVQNINQEYQN